MLGVLLSFCGNALNQFDSIRYMYITSEMYMIPVDRIQFLCWFHHWEEGSIANLSYAKEWFCLQILVFGTKLDKKFKMDKPKQIPPSIGIKLLSAGTAASLAEVATIPIDTVKVRLQVIIVKQEYI